MTDIDELRIRFESSEKEIDCNTNWNKVICLLIVLLGLTYLALKYL